MRIPSRSSIYFTLSSVLVLLSFATAVGQAAGTGSFYRSADRLGRVLQRINDSYVEEIPSDTLVDAAIKGLSTVLDPHTSYFVDKEVDDLKVHTEAQFGGLGITIGVRENVLTVISPLDGTPAQRMGIQAGDRIVEIDGKSTRGITVDDAVSKLRGKPGTKVTIKIWRTGLTEPLPFTITREIIKIESVPWAGILPGKVGYLKLVQFAKPTSDEVEAALLKLKEQGATSYILDLRWNPGGLLNQAVEISELFLPKGRVVVSTRGRVSSQNIEMESRRSPVIDTGTPLVVIVNGGSASASEIVAGAIQDWDRGVILGTQSFGKGSVQTLLPMDQTHLLKLTMAYYYTPSGRCINKRENSVRWGRDSAAAPDTVADNAPKKESEDELDYGESSASDTLLDTTGHQSFRTKVLGRKVWDAGGILPDMRVSARRLTLWQQDVERKNLFFRWAIQARAKIQAKKKIDGSFRASDALIADFRTFLATDSVKFTFDSPQARLLKEMRKLSKMDSARGENLPEAERKLLNTRLDALQEALDKAGESLFEANREYVREGLTREILMAAGGVSLATPFQLESDPQVIAAAALLRDPVRYRQVLSPAASAAPMDTTAAK
ncbi:MAG: S41 family peptidase [Fibrobacteria bacterium]|nr:S41 family peptidase [Fibrobacteria bacterium]